MGVMMAGFVKAANVGPEDGTPAGPHDLPWQLMVAQQRTWASQVALFGFIEHIRSLEQMFMHIASEERITILYNQALTPVQVQTAVVNSCDMPEILQVCRQVVDKYAAGITATIAKYLSSPASDPTQPSYVPPSTALSQADRLEMLERSNILFLPEAWFNLDLEKNGVLTACVQRPRWYHFWADAFRIDDPTKLEVVEGILEAKSNGFYWVYPKCDPGLVSFWKGHVHIWNPVDDLKPISLLVDRAFPCPAYPVADRLDVAAVRLNNVRLLPLDHVAGSTAVGVRVSPTFGTGGIFVIPNVDGGLIRGELGDFPRPEASALSKLLGLSTGKTADLWQRAAKHIAKLAITYEQELLNAMSPPRIRMWPVRKAQHKPHGWMVEQAANVAAEKRKFESVPQAWQLLQSASFDEHVTELGLWDPGAKWLANTLCMMTAMRHMRAATLFESTYTTDLYDPEKLALALLTAPATDFHAVWLCRVLGGGQEVVVKEKQEIKGATLTENADAIFG